jgi:pyruvate/2-oxoglutarate/acetoin dehydrogenase E1 component
LREITFREAVREALAEEMDRDGRVFLMGEDIALYGGCFGVTKGLLERFGHKRVINTPLSEAAITGVAVGAALYGLRPVAEIMFMDFVTLALDQLANHAAKFHYSYGGQGSVPMVVRTAFGAGKRYGPTHSQSLEAWLAHVPGLKVVAPSSPGDAKGLMVSAIRDNNPVIFLEHKLLYDVKGPVQDPCKPVPLCHPTIVRQGTDVTLVSYSRGVIVSLEASAELERLGYSAEVIDLRTISPLDSKLLVESARKTGRVVVVTEDTLSFGVSAEIAAKVSEEAFGYLDAPVARIAMPDIPIPFSRTMEDMATPSTEKVVEASLKVLENA